MRCAALPWSNWTQGFGRPGYPVGLVVAKVAYPPSKPKNVGTGPDWSTATHRLMLQMNLDISSASKLKPLILFNKGIDKKWKPRIVAAPADPPK